MMRQSLFATFLVIASAVTGFANVQYGGEILQKVFSTLVSYTVLYIVFKVLLEAVGAKRISDGKTRYMFRKALSVLFIAIFSIIFVRIWVQDPQALLVAYGLVGAGVAISLQDVFKNFAGGIVLFMSRSFKAGDRIEIRGVYGDVIDIGLFYTKIMEIRGWVNADQVTGRTVTVPNGAVLGGEVKNFTEENSFIWEELTVPISYKSDWKSAADRLETIVQEETADLVKKADRELSRIRQRYVLSERSTEPRIFIELTDNWVNFHIRYVTDVSRRRHFHDVISRKILDAVNEMEEVSVASETLEITTEMVDGE